MTIFFLKNGKKVVIDSVDFDSRLIVRIENIDSRRFCIVDGSLHTINDPDGYAEPCSPLKDEYQLNDESYNYLSRKFSKNTSSFF